MSGESTNVSRGPGRVRASDVEREEFAKTVRDAVGEGRLSLGEGEERLAAVYATTYRDELGPLIADLPRDQDQDRAFTHGWDQDRPWGPGREALGQDWRHHRHPHRWPGGGGLGLVRHTGFVAMVAVVLVSIWAASGAHFFWPAIPLAFLAFGLLRHTLMLRFMRRGWRGGRN